MDWRAKPQCLLQGTLLIASNWQTIKRQSKDTSVLPTVVVPPRGQKFRFSVAQSIENNHAETLTKVQTVLTDGFHAPAVFAVLCQMNSIGPATYSYNRVIAISAVELGLCGG